MTKKELEARVRELEAELASTEGELDAVQVEFADFGGNHGDDCVAFDALVEVECRRCHRMFLSHPNTRYCTRDCRYGWTPAPTFEEWYAGLNHGRFAPTPDEMELNGAD